MKPEIPEFLVVMDLKNPTPKDATYNIFNNLEEAKEMKSVKGDEYFIYKLEDIDDVDGIPYWIKLT